MVLGKCVTMVLTILHGVMIVSIAQFLLRSYASGTVTYSGGNFAVTCDVKIAQLQM